MRIVWGLWFAGDLQDSKSTSGGLLCIFGSHTFVPISLDVQETDFSFTQFYRSWNNFSRCRFTQGWNPSTWSLGFGYRQCFVSFFTKPSLRAHLSCLAVSPVGTSLMRNFDLYFTKRWTFVLSDVCLTQCSPCESYSSNWSQDFCASGGSASCDTQLNCRTLFTIATALLLSSVFGFLFGWSSTFRWGNELSAPNLHPDFVLQNWHSGGCQDSQGDFGASTFQEVFTRRSIEFLRLASAPGISFSRHTATSFFVLYCGSEGGSAFGVGFARSLLSMPETALVSLRTLAFFSPLVTNTFSSFNTTQSLWLLTGPLSGLSVPRDWPSWSGVLDDLVQSRSNLSVHYFEIREIISRSGSRGFHSSTDFTRTRITRTDELFEWLWRIPRSRVELQRKIFTRS